MTRGLEERWIERMERALALLADRLDDPPSLQELASAAGSSPFHFHRIWRTLMGEPVSRTVTRLRIAAAQQQLREPGATVTGVAMDAGFATPQGFARAFRRVVGMSPSDFLASDDPAAGILADPAAPVRVELREACALVALHRDGGGAYRQLNALYQRLWDWAEGAGLLGGLQGLYGIAYDDPASVPEDQLRYAACLALGDGIDPPAPFAPIDLPAGDYACLHHVGPYDDLDAIDQVLVGWVIASDREPADLPIIHHFHDDPDVVAAEDLRMDALILLQPLA